MMSDALQAAGRYRKSRRRKALWFRIVSVLAAIVVFCTSYALILPAITKERTSFCGLEEHAHSEACYEAPLKALVCDPVHTHTDECMNGENVWICGQAEYVWHTHSALCYAADGLIVCQLPERVSETADTEGSPTTVHSHGETCVDENGTYVCGQTEVIEHSHSEDCFETVPSTVLICSKTEHSHEEKCYVDQAADVETQEEWEASVPTSFSGDWALDLAAVAQSQLGYQESTANVEVLENGLTKGYSRYGAWYGQPYADWNTLFVLFCLQYAGVEGAQFPRNADVDVWCESLKAASLYADPLVYVPSVGDLAFLEENRVAVVTDYAVGDDGCACVTVIEGDINGAVVKAVYAVDAQTVLGFGTVSAAFEQYAVSRPIQKQYADDTILVTASYNATAGIPETAELIVRPIAQDGDVFDTCLKEAHRLIDSTSGQTVRAQITDFRLFDIFFEADGEEIQPTDAVDICISFPAQEVDPAQINVVHYTKDGTELSEVTACEIDKEGNLNTTFETESFSLFAVVTAESAVKNIVTVEPYTVTASNVTALPDSLFAVTYGELALGWNADDGLLACEVMLHQDNGSLTADEALVRWQFERTASSQYAICTTYNDTTYYLTVNGTALTVTEDLSLRTIFTAARSGTGLTLQNAGQYIQLSAPTYTTVTDEATGVTTTQPVSSGVSMGTSMVLELFSVPSGTFTVTFDGKLSDAPYMDKTQNHKYSDGTVVSEQTDADGYVTLPTSAADDSDDSVPGPGNHPLKLNGWFDIENGIYYDSSMLGKRIKVTSDTTFYPEWIAYTYDIGIDDQVIADQPDTRDFIDTYVFDYTELFNMQSVRYTEPNTTYPNGLWTFDPDSELGFVFFDYLAETSDSAGYNIGYVKNKDTAVGGVTVNAEKTAGTRGNKAMFPGTITPGIANEARLDALFGTTPVPGKIQLGEGDWLYEYDASTGFYYYNSALNAASYNQSEQRFYVYDYTVNIDSNNSLHDFIPLNHISLNTDASDPKIYEEKNTDVNYWFGMKSEIDFYLPEDNGSAGNVAANGTDLQLRFSGDDDVWIFIDGQLALDLGGVHDIVYGEINFATGKVTTGQALSSGQVATNTAGTYGSMPGVSYTDVGVTTTDLPFDLPAGEHKITVHYLERGSSLSNCAVYFNLSPSYRLDLTKRDRDNATFLAGAEFHIYEDEACTQSATLYHQEEDGSMTLITNATVSTDENGVASFWGLQSGKTYYIKEAKPPPTYPSMEKYTIRLNLSEQGRAVLVAISENGEEWVFADAYITSDTAHTHLVQLNVYNDKHVGGEKELYVEKAWGEGSETLPDTVTVRLYADGEPTTRTLTLSAANDWKDIFYELPVYDDEGNEILYTVKEEGDLRGFTVSYQEVTGLKEIETVTPGYAVWEAATSLTAGATYRIYSSSNLALQCSESGAVSAASVSDTEESQLWTVVQSGSSIALQNKAYPTRYLYIASNNVTTSTSLGSNTYVTYSNNRFSVRPSWRTYYLRDPASGSTAYRTTTSSGSATSYSLMKYTWVDEVINTETEEIPGWRVTNTPWPKTLSVPLSKAWDDSVPAESQQAVTLALYLVTSGEESSAQKIQTVTLSSENGWAGAFENLDYPDENTYYCVVEESDSFRIRYGLSPPSDAIASDDPLLQTKLVSILIGDRMQTAVRVPIGDDGVAMQVDVTNAAAVELPDTGGIGTKGFTAAGILLTVFAVVLLLRRYCRTGEEALNVS